MKDSMRSKLVGLCRRLEEIDAMLAAPDAADDMNRFRALSQERAEIEPVTVKMHAYEQTEGDIEAAQEMANEDPSFSDAAQEEIKACKAKLEALEKDLEVLLLPKDPNDSRNIFLEIRAGTGGDESALFAGDLLRMYLRYAERQGWQVEIVSKNESDLGGYKEVICRVIGEGAYSRLKFESGGHRVQRVPATESQGRIHTSAATVAIMPEAEEVDLDLKPEDLRFDVYRSSGPGGQSVNTTDSAVRVTHIPTGLVVCCQDEKSQHKNKAKGLKILCSRLLQMKQDEQNAALADQRRAQVGTGDRSERIRTYNFPQGRVTDHRINLTLYSLGKVLEGEIQELVDALVTHAQTEALKAQASS